MLQARLEIFNVFIIAKNTQTSAESVSPANAPCPSAEELYQPAVSGNKWAFLKQQNYKVVKSV